VSAQYETSGAYLEIKQGVTKHIPGFSMSGAIGADSTGIYLEGYLKDNMHIVKFNSALEYALDAPVTLSLAPKSKFQLLEYLLKDGRLFVFYEEHKGSRSRTTFELYMQELEVVNLSPKNEPVLLCTNKAEKLRFSDDSRIEVHFQDDYNEFVTVYTETVSNEPNQIIFDIFDFTGKKRMSLEPVPEMNSLDYFRNLGFGEDGRVYVVYGYQNLYVFDRSGKFDRKIPLGVADMRVGGRGKILIDDSQNIHLSYVNFAFGENGLLGFVNEKINKDEEVQTNVINISKEYALLNQGGEALRKMENELNKYEHSGLSNLILLDKKVLSDGSLMLAYEYYLKEEVKNYIDKAKAQSEIASSYNIYTYGDIHIIKIKPSGEMDWIRKIPKLQTYEVGSRLQSAYVHWRDGETFIFMNDNPANNKDMGTDVPEPYKRNTKDVTLVHINEEGVVNRNALFSERNNIELSPRCTWIMEDGDCLVMPLIESKVVQLIQFDFK
jgi:hypothetical protein